MQSRKLYLQYPTVSQNPRSWPSLIDLVLKTKPKYYQTTHKIISIPLKSVFGSDRHQC